MPQASLEIMIERWNNADGSTDFLWSVWQSGRRIHMGGRHRSSEAAQQEATSFCQAHFGVAPQRVREL